MIVLGVALTAPCQCEPTEYERHDIACQVLHLVPGNIPRFDRILTFTIISDASGTP